MCCVCTDAYESGDRPEHVHTNTCLHALQSLMEVNKLYEQRYSKPSKHVVYEDDEEDDFIAAFGPVEDDAKEETLYDRDGRTDAAGAGEYDDVFKSLWKVNISTSSAKKKSGSDGSGKAGDVDTVLSSPSFSSALTFECVRKNTDTFALTDLQPSSIYVLQVRSDDPVQHHVYVYTSELYKSSSDDSSNDDLHAFDYGEALLSHMRLPTFHPIYVVKEGVASAGISGFRKAFQ